MFPARRLEIVLSGAGLAIASSALAGNDASRILAEIPWDVLVIMASLGVVSRVLGESGVFTRLAVRGTLLTRAEPRWILVGGALLMFFISGLVNNITALLLVLPIVIAIFELVGTTQRHLRWTIGVLLVACNLGGASTPIGDFPAILLLGAGAMAFKDYLVLAFPAALVALVLLLVIVQLVVRPTRGMDASPLRREITVAAVEALHRRVRLDPWLLIPGLVVLAAMLAAWIVFPASVVPPHMIAWIGGVVVLAATAHRTKTALIKGIDVEATLFLFALFALVGTVSASGFFADLGDRLADLPLPPSVKLVILVGTTGLATGLFSAGPSMAAMLEVGQPLASSVAPAAVYIGLALGVCAGSSLLLTAATSGPLTESLIARASLADDQGRPVSFTFKSFLPVGVLSFSVILGVGLVTVGLIAGT